MIDLKTSQAQRRAVFLTRSVILLALAAACSVLFLAARADASYGARVDLDRVLMPLPFGVDIAATRSLRTVSTVHTLSGTSGANGWFVSAVTVALTTTDGTGNITTLYRVNQGDWFTYTVPFVIESDGTHVLEYYSRDGNGSEPVHVVQVLVDTTPPSSTVALLPGHLTWPSFTVSWSGTDNGGSGIAGYDIQYKNDITAAWRNWLTKTTALSSTFSLGEHGRVYYFRSSAYDMAGNSETHVGQRGDTSVFVDSIVNGSFESGTFSDWTVSGEMSKSIALALEVGGTGQWAALLGSPDYGDSITPTAALHVPTDTFAAIVQAIRIPPLYDLPAPALSLRYRILTYDVVWGCNFPDRLYDSFDLTIYDLTGSVLSTLLRDGNYDCQTYTNYVDTHGGVPPLTEIVAQRTIDLSPFAGRRVLIELRNSNRRDWFNNTWTFVDDISVINQPTRFYRVNLPFIVLNNAMNLPTLSGGYPGYPYVPGQEIPRRRR